MARERLLERCRQAVEAELERIAAAFEQAGFVFIYSSAQRERQLDWTFQRLAMRQPVRTIADRAGTDCTEAKPSENALRKKTARIAKFIGLAKFPTTSRLPEEERLSPDVFSMLPPVDATTPYGALAQEAL